MPACSAFGCTNRPGKKIKGISFHRFPKNATLREAWVKACRRANWSPSNVSVLCSQHFSEDQFNTTLKNVYLKEKAVPSIFKSFPSYYQKTPRKRKSPKKRPACSSVNSQNETIELQKENTPEQQESVSSITKSDLWLLAETALAERSEFSPTENSAEFGQVSLGEKETKDAATSPIKVRDIYMEDSDVEVLKRKYDESQNSLVKYKKKIKILQQKNRRQKEKINNLSTLFDQLRAKHFMHEDSLSILQRTTSPNADILKRQVAKATAKPVERKYSAELRAFALTLHFYSPRAYEFVREKFDTCLPHSRTISKWYQKVDAAPGFSSESLKALSLMTEQNKNLLFSLMYDEMAIKRHVEFDGQVFHGYIDMGTEINDDSLPVAKEALVLMVVAVNSHFKVPVGYFLVEGLGASQKSSLVLQCLTILHSFNVNIVSLTFDGLSSNLSVATHLGCVLDPYNLDPKFKHPVTSQDIVVFLDPAHMIKLVRNTLGDKKSLVDPDGRFVDWKYIKELSKLQEEEGLNLCNKLRPRHMAYFKQKMNVKLAAQTLSKSVADAISFCSNELNIPEFQNSEATVNFCNIFNDLFDILNSRSQSQIGFKKPICEDNFVTISERLNEIKNYILCLKTAPNGCKIIHSNRKTGFLGFLVCIESAKFLYKELVTEKGTLKYLPTYKFSQDHLELFFQCVRSQGGCSTNPTARQFKAAYKKLLINSEIKSNARGNAYPLESINILTVSSCLKPEDVINYSSERNRTIDQVPITSSDTFDHDYLFDPGSLSRFSEHIVYYIAGFVSRKLSQSLMCNICTEALISPNSCLSSSIISYKSRGNLVHPTVDVYKICKTAETVFRRSVNEDGGRFLKKRHGILQTEVEVMSNIYSQNLFRDLDFHSYDQGPLENHVTNLKRAIVKQYLMVRYRYWGKNVERNSNSSKYLYTKIAHFQGV